MKKFQFVLVLFTFVGLFLIDCSDKVQSPVEPNDQGSLVSLNKKGPVVHSVEGSGLFFNQREVDGKYKNAGARYAAHEYADGTFDGDFEVNSANGTGEHDFKLNGKVISFKVYEDVGQYHGKMAVFLGNEKTGILAGWYCVFFAIDNGKPGQTTAPDQVNGILLELPSEDFVMPDAWGPPWAGKTIIDFANMGPDEIINSLFVADCDKGNIIVQ